MADEEHHPNTESLLKLKILSEENLKPIPSLIKKKSFIQLWINPLHKQTTKTLTHSTNKKFPIYNHNLTFPLSLQTLQNPNSQITIQIIAISSPIQHKKVIGTTVLLLSDVKFNEEIFTLQLWRPSGRAQGLIRISAKIEINLGLCRDVPIGCVTGVPLMINPMDTVVASQYHNVVPFPVPVPSAPVEELILGIEDDQNGGTVSDTTEEKCVLLEPLGIDDMGDKVEVDSCSERNSSSNCDSMTSVGSDGSNVLRSLLVGFLGGTVAVATVLIGSANS